MKGWECLFKHREQQLFLSVYVDDFKMAGKKTNIAPMWKKLREKLDLEPRVSLSSNVYLGCGQREIPVQKDLQTGKTELFKRLFAKNKVSLPDTHKHEDAESTRAPSTDDDSNSIEIDLPTKTHGLVHVREQAKRTAKKSHIHKRMRDASR